MHLANNYARLFVVVTVLGLEVVQAYIAKAEIVGGMIPNLIAFGLFLGAIGYFCLLGPYLEKVKRMDEWPTVEAANLVVGAFGLLLFVGATAYFA